MTNYIAQIKHSFQKVNFGRKRTSQRGKCSLDFIDFFFMRTVHKHLKKGIGGNCQFNNLNDIRDDDGCLYLSKSMSGTVRGSCLIFTRPFLLRRLTRTVQSLIAYWLFLLALLFFFAVSPHILQLFGGIDKDFAPCQNSLLSHFSIIFVIIHSDYQISYWILLHLLERLGLSRLEGGKWSNV